MRGLDKIKGIHRRLNNSIRTQIGTIVYDGCFTVVSPVDMVEMLVVCSKGKGWDHVSVSRPDRIPTWPEMCHIKRMFFREGEVVMQLHVPSKDNINFEPNCLHLWRPNRGPGIPTPPKEMV